ncbi:MAG: hypothetical protein ABIQ74_08020 [Chitinophagales bacterium]
MNPRIAILDLGTNTFNLLVAEVRPDHSFEILFKAEEFVKLGEDGVDKIGEHAFQRGVEQIKKYRINIDERHPHKVIAFGTAAIRRASNGDNFIRAIGEACPMEFHKISGDEEAELIYHGARQAISLGEQPVLIMDIGGGSTEFIIASHEKIHWKKSFQIGSSVLKQHFHHQEPISSAEQVNLISFLQSELQPLLSHAQIFSVKHLIGTSGTFDSFVQMLYENAHAQPLHPFGIATEIPVPDFYRLCLSLIQSTMDERLKMKGLIWFRAEMMVVAAMLAGYVVETCNIKRITRSAYALKEGALLKFIQN